MDQGWAILAGKQRPGSGAVHSWTAGRRRRPLPQAGPDWGRWRGHPESNWGMSDLQSDALPAWLWRHPKPRYSYSPFPLSSTSPSGVRASAGQARRGRKRRSLRRRLPSARDHQPAREAPQHPAQLAPFVAQVRVLSALVGLGRVAVDELQLDHAEGDPPVAYVHGALGQPHRKLGDEIEHLVGVAGEFVVLRLLLVVEQPDLELRGHVTQRGPVPQQLAEADQRVLRLTGHHEVEGHQQIAETDQDREHVIAVVRDYAVADAIVDLRRQRLLLRQELGDQAVPRLHAARRRHHRKSLAAELLHAVVDALGDQLAEFVFAHPGTVQEPDRLDVVDDVHHLENETGDPPELRVAHSRRKQEQILHPRRLRDLFGDHVPEGGAQVVDGLVEDALEPVAIEGIVGLEQAEPEVLIDFLAGLEVEPPPVDHRPAAKDQAHALQIAERPAVGQRDGGLGEHGAAACCNRMAATSNLPGPDALPHCGATGPKMYSEAWAGKPCRSQCARRLRPLPVRERTAS